MNNRLCLFAMVGVHLFCLASTPAFAWGDDGHEIVGMIADHYLEPAVRVQVQTILASDATRLTPDTGIASEATWADRYRDSDRKTTKVRYNQTYNWHFIDLELDGADVRTACFGQPALPPGTVATNGAAKDCIVDKITEFAAELHDPGIDADERRMALQFLLHFVGDLHQPLHVGSVYLDPDGKLLDPDIAHAIDPKTETHGGNTIHDQNVNLHGEWDDIPTDLGDAATRELLAEARSVPPSQGPIEGWPAEWATDTLLVAHHAFEGLSFEHEPPPKTQWTVSFDDHTAYLWLADITKRRQLAKGGARLAEILNTIWPP